MVKSGTTSHLRLPSVTSKADIHCPKILINCISYF